MNKYYNLIGAPYEEPEGLRLNNRIKVLKELNNLKLDSRVIAYIHQLRPSLLRILPFLSQYDLDFKTWRVSIYLKKNGNIDFIEQEVEVIIEDSI